MATSDRIKELREKKRLSQKELGARVNVSAQVISNWERRYTTPNADDIRRLADALDTSVDYLLERPGFITGQYGTGKSHMLKYLYSGLNLDSRLEEALSKASLDQKQKILDYLEGRTESLIDYSDPQVATFMAFMEDLSKLPVTELMRKYGFIDGDKLLTDEEARNRISRLKSDE